MTTIFSRKFSKICRPVCLILWLTVANFPNCVAHHGNLIIKQIESILDYLFKNNWTRFTTEYSLAADASVWHCLQPTSVICFLVTGQDQHQLCTLQNFLSACKYVQWLCYKSADLPLWQTCKNQTLIHNWP